MRCALEICQGLKEHPHLHLRMGIHSGPVNAVTDVNDRSNVAGDGMNLAQRIMDCADAGHILLSKRVADDLVHFTHWQPNLHDFGEVEVKHGTTISLFNLYGEGLATLRCQRGLKYNRADYFRVALLNAGPAREVCPDWGILFLLLAIGLSTGGFCGISAVRRGKEVCPAEEHRRTAL